MAQFLSYNDKKRQFKWTGSIEELKTLCTDDLGLKEGTESVKSSCTVLKFPDAMLTINFYGATKTLQLQGNAKDDFEKRLRLLLALTASTDSDPSASATSDIQRLEDDEDVDEITVTPGRPEPSQADSGAPSLVIVPDGPSIQPSSVPHNLPCNCSPHFETLRKEIEDLKEKISNVFPANSRPFEYVNMQIEIAKLRQENESLRTTVTVLSSQLAQANSITEQPVQASKNGNPSTSKNVISSGNSEAGPSGGQATNRKAKPKQTATQPSGNQPKQHNQQPHDVSQATRKPITVIVGDSMIQHIRGWELSESTKVVVKSFSGATTDDMEDYIKPILRKEPANVILHVGTNDLKSQDPEHICQSIASLSTQIEQDSPTTTVAISAIILRKDDRNITNIGHKISKVNGSLKALCRQKNICFIEHKNIRPEQHLNRGGLHLNKAGSEVLSKNFKSHINGAE